MTQRLFTADQPLRLIGGRHRESGRITFPCPADAIYEAVPLGRRGALWSYTVQRFRPKSPPYIGLADFEPWAVGYVELPGEVIVEARLTGMDFDQIRIGMALELHPLALDDGPATLIPAFRPVAGAEA